MIRAMAKAEISSLVEQLERGAGPFVVTNLVTQSTFMGLDHRRGAIEAERFKIFAGKGIKVHQTVTAFCFQYLPRLVLEMLGKLPKFLYPHVDGYQGFVHGVVPFLMQDDGRLGRWVRVPRDPPAFLLVVAGPAESLCLMFGINVLAVRDLWVSYCLKRRFGRERREVKGDNGRRR